MISLLRKLVLGLAFPTLVLALTNCGPNEAQRAEIEKAKQAAAEKRLKLEDECQLVKQAVTVIRERVKTLPDDLATSATVCSDFYEPECRSKVTIMFVLDKLGEIELFNKIIEVGDDCQREYEFAKKFGIEAWLDHSELLQAAVERAAERAQEECRTDPGGSM